MLRDSREFLDHAVQATDGAIGDVKDVYFDDDAWVIRYFVVETGAWLMRRRVLIAPAAVTALDRSSRRISVNLTKSQVRHSPDVATDEPVSRQYEREYLKYYGYPFYWGGGGVLGGGAAHPGPLASGLEHEGAASARRLTAEQNRRADAQADSEHRAHADHHLRSMETVKRYHILAADGEIGHVDGFLTDETGWAIRYLVVVTSDWWSGHEVLLSVEWIDDVRWDDNRVLVSLTRNAIKAAPEYRAGHPLERDRETDLHHHYGLGAYWDREVREPRIL
jgi:hypothetical protein